MPTIGAHVSAAGGLYPCFANAEAIGVEAIQIFGSSPQQWKFSLPTAENIIKFKAEQKRTKIATVFLHAPYLINLASAKPDLWNSSVTALVGQMQIAEALGATGVIFHLGSFTGGSLEQGIKNMAKGMQEVLNQVPGQVQLIMENSSGGGSKIGSTPEEIGAIFDLVKSDRVKICLDTQHAFAAGLLNEYSPSQIDDLVQRCEQGFGWQNVVALHLNDSKTASGSCHDRHENIGEGMIGLAGFKNLSKNKQFTHLPWILEVPGFAGGGPDQKNVQILKKIVGVGK